MMYPPAPWSLKGYALHTLQLVDTDRVRTCIPSEIEIVPIFPGKTLCCVYFASYEEGSILQYHELIVAVLARYRRKIGSWITHIYVDSESSMAGGREIWGLPKELAHFSWHLEGQHVLVEQSGNVVCQIHFEHPRSLWKQPVRFPVISLRGEEVLSFVGRTSAALGTSRGRLDVPAQSPLATLGLPGNVRTYHHRDLHFVAPEPKVIARAATLKQDEKAALSRGNV